MRQRVVRRWPVAKRGANRKYITPPRACINNSTKDSNNCSISMLRRVPKAIIICGPHLVVYSRLRTFPVARIYTVGARPSIIVCKNIYWRSVIAADQNFSPMEGRGRMSRATTKRIYQDYRNNIEFPFVTALSV